MNNILNSVINEQVKMVFEENSKNIMQALLSNCDDLSVPEGCVPLVLNAVRLSIVYSTQLTMENLMALGVLSLDNKSLQKILLKHLSDS